MSLFRVDASIQGQYSSSRELGDVVQNHWLTEHPTATVVSRDLAAAPVPATYWAAAVAAGRMPAEQWSEEQQAATALAQELHAELKKAETIVVATGLYNWGLNQLLKTWIDLVITVAPQGEQFLAGKDVALVVTRGGYYGEDGPKAGWDHGTPWLLRIFAEVWGANVSVVERDFTLVGVVPQLDAFTEQAAAIKQAAVARSQQVGTALAVSYRSRKQAEPQAA